MRPRLVVVGALFASAFAGGWSVAHVRSGWLRWRLSRGVSRGGAM